MAYPTPKLQLLHLLHAKPLLLLRDLVPYPQGWMFAPAIRLMRSKSSPPLRRGSRRRMMGRRMLAYLLWLLLLSLLLLLLLLCG